MLSPRLPAFLCVIACSVCLPCVSAYGQSKETVDALRRCAGTDGFVPYAANPVLMPGPPGEWDAGAIGSVSVVKVAGICHLFYEGWGRKTGEDVHSLDLGAIAIGHATSLDGAHWVKDPANPVLPAGSNSTDWDHNGTWDPFVIHEDGVFKLWYGGGNDPHCEWGFAVSRDGTHFVKKGRISALGQVEDDHVVHDRGSRRYFMYYWDRSHEPMGLYVSESPNETDFDFKSALPIKIAGEDYPGMYKFPYVTQVEGRWYMLYANFVRPHCPDSTTRLAVSTDGVHWTKANGNLLEGQDGALLPFTNDLYLMYFGPRGHFDGVDDDVRLALYNGRLIDLIRR